MDVHHQVAPGSVLHDKAHMLRCLEACKQVDQERVADAVHRLKDPLLTHEADGEIGEVSLSQSGWALIG